MTPVIGDQFGAIKTRSGLVTAVIDTLQLWEEEYLAEIERQHDKEPRYLPTIKAWERGTKGLEKHVASRLPACLVRCPNLADKPVRYKDGTTAKWAVLVSVIVASTDQVATEELADLYTAAFRTLLEHNKSLGGYAVGVEWIDESYDDMPSSKRDNLGAGSAIFEISVERTVISGIGPVGTPQADPYGDVREDSPTVTADGVPNNVIEIEGD